MANELSGIDQLVSSRLLADGVLAALVGAGNVFADLAPEGQPCPYVVFQFQTGKDIVGLGATRLFSEPLYLVKAVTQEDSYVTAGQIADRIDAVMTGLSGLTASSTLYVMGCYREQPFRLFEVDKGLRFNYVGGLYRLYVQRYS